MTESSAVVVGGGEHESYESFFVLPHRAKSIMSYEFGTRTLEQLSLLDDSLRPEYWNLDTYQATHAYFYYRKLLGIFGSSETEGSSNSRINFTEILNESMEAVIDKELEAGNEIDFKVWAARFHGIFIMADILSCVINHDEDRIAVMTKVLASEKKSPLMTMLQKEPLGHDEGVEWFMLLLNQVLRDR